MAESPKSKRSNLNKSTILKRTTTFGSMKDSEGESDSDDNNQVKLPEIILNKLHTTKATVEFDNIPGLKTTKNQANQHKRTMTEKKGAKEREHSAVGSTK